MYESQNKVAFYLFIYLFTRTNNYFSHVSPFTAFIEDWLLVVTVKPYI